MSKLTLFARYALVKNTNITGSSYLICRSYAKKTDGNSSGSDTEKKPIPKKAASNEALNKLNMLLRDMTELPPSRQPNLELARPKRRKEPRSEPNVETVKTEKVEPKLIDSVKNVAESLGGNVKQTESELLSKLLNLPDKEPGDKQSASLNLGEIVKGMKIDREKVPEHMSRSQQVKGAMKYVKNSRNDDGSQQTASRRIGKGHDERVAHVEKINLFGSQPLGIFKGCETFVEGLRNETWEMLEKRELRLAVTHPPSNYFQHMILWTEQGKTWKFPIDNEQGMENEKNIYFTEHVFLEKHLEPWCPPKGPIRHFMELVCVGLSKNPYMTVKDKQDHIVWYKEYFADKQKMLKEIGAVPQQFEMKQIEASKD